MYVIVSDVRSNMFQNEEKYFFTIFCAIDGMKKIIFFFKFYKMVRIEK